MADATYTPPRKRRLVTRTGRLTMDLVVVRASGAGRSVAFCEATTEAEVVVVRGAGAAGPGVASDGVTGGAGSCCAAATPVQVSPAATIQAMTKLRMMFLLWFSPG